MRSAARRRQHVKVYEEIAAEITLLDLEARKQLEERKRQEQREEIFNSLEEAARRMVLRTFEAAKLDEVSKDLHRSIRDDFDFLETLRRRIPKDAGEDMPAEAPESEDEEERSRREARFQEDDAKPKEGGAPSLAVEEKTPPEQLRIIASKPFVQKAAASAGFAIGDRADRSKRRRMQHGPIGEEAKEEVSQPPHTAPPMGEREAWGMP
eukprot:Polyplicarium_translucidae@DN3137_c1_g1_i1.p1